MSTNVLMSPNTGEPMTAAESKADTRGYREGKRPYFNPYSFVTQNELNQFYELGRKRWKDEQSEEK